jgi:hypothetical protein
LQLLKNLSPDLAGTNTGDKEVLDGFFSLTAKRADSRMRKTTLGKAISSPASSFHRKPKLCRFAVALPRCYELPAVLIQHSPLQDRTIGQLPDVKIQILP